jgi:transcriptional regulator with XRE-family HTH domain
LSIPFCADFRTFDGDDEMTSYEKYCLLRDSKNIKDSDVSKATGIGKSTFSDWKSGRSKPKQDKAQKIADFFGVSTDYFFRDDVDIENTIVMNPTVPQDAYDRWERYLQAPADIQQAIDLLLGYEKPSV